MGNEEEEQTMGQTIDEQLSALLDGELPVEQQELLLRRLERDTDLRARFGRYSMIGDLLTDPRPQAAALQIADRVRDRLAEEVGPAPAVASVAPIAVQAPQTVPQRASVAPERMTRYLVTHAQYANSASRQFVDSHLVMPAYQRTAWQTTGQR